MRHFFTFISIFTGLFLFSSCSNKQYQALFERRGTMADSLLRQNQKPDTSTDKKLNSDADYRIRAQDVLQVRNLQNIKYIVDEVQVGTAAGAAGNATSSMGQTYQVENDGTVALPVIGHVPVAGLTRSEAAKAIEGLYRNKLLKDPIIEVTITNLKVTLLGEVKAQGNFPLVKDKTTLVDMIGAAGGLTDKADEKNIRIIHGTEKNAKITEVDLSDVRSIYDPKTILRNGDIVYVSQNKRAIRNDNLQNFSFIVQPALLLINALLIIFTFTRK